MPAECTTGGRSSTLLTAGSPHAGPCRGGGADGFRNDAAMLLAIATLALPVALTACTRDPAGATTSAAAAPVVDDARLRQASSAPDDWLTFGRDYDEQRFSPLTQINRDNVRELGLAWYVDLEPTRGMEATPLVVDGVLYATDRRGTSSTRSTRAPASSCGSYDPEGRRASGAARLLRRRQSRRRGLAAARSSSARSTAG